MGKAPAVIIIARHGARLDQADKRWHLNSPTPYDPPLTYGGWTQGRALGARIGEILSTREEETLDSSPTNANGGILRKRKRKQRIIIHSSPFTRCVQTSIAIGAGIAQFNGRAPPVAKHHLMHSGSPHIQGLEGSPRLSAIPEPAEGLSLAPLLSGGFSVPLKPELATSASLQANHEPKIAELRVDAFLGEWLSPDYFENIAPPPGSAMMVAVAKADLLRPSETIEGSDPGKISYGHFPGGWSLEWSPAGSGDEKEEKTGLANMAALGHALPNRTRSSTHGSDSPPSSNLNSSPARRHTARLNTKVLGFDANASGDSPYTPPTPTYALSPSEPIPVGYVAHARDACISVSYSWDSMRPPQSWGNGGEYGEEWSSMHRRFRNGLTKMIEWYEEHGPGVSKTAERFMGGIGAEGEGEEEDDLVVVLVTHGAGCNALLGALTNQPVLLDVGMASLTLAVRKQDAKSMRQRRREMEEGVNGSGVASQVARRSSRRGSIDMGMAEDYEMKYSASTDHLRAGSNPLNPSAVSPRIGPAGSNSPYRRPATSFSNDNFSIGDAMAPSGLMSFPGNPFSAGKAMTVGGPLAGSGQPVSTSWTAGNGLAGGSLYRSASGHSALSRAIHGHGYASSPVSSAPRISSGLWRSGTGESLGSNYDGASESGAESDSLPNFSGVTTAAGMRKKSGLSGSLDRSQKGETLGGPALAMTVNRVEPNVASHARCIEDQEQEPEQLINSSNSNSNSTGKGPGAGSSGEALASDLIKAKQIPTPIKASRGTGLWGGGGMARSPGMMKRRWTVENSAA